MSPLVLKYHELTNIPSLHAGVRGWTDVMCNVKGFVSDWRCLPSLFRFRGRAQVWAGRRWAVMFGMRALYCHQHYHHQHQHTAGTSEYKECYLDVESTGNLVLLKTIMSGAVRW